MMSCLILYYSPPIKVIITTLSHLHYIHATFTLHNHHVHKCTIYTLHILYIKTNCIYTHTIYILHIPYTHYTLYRCQELYSRVHDPEVVRPSGMGQRTRVYTQPRRVTGRYICIDTEVYIICVYMYTSLYVYTHTYCTYVCLHNIYVYMCTYM